MSFVLVESADSKGAFVPMITFRGRLRPSRVSFLAASCTIAVLFGIGDFRSSPAAAQQPPLRLALVMVPDDLLRPLLPMFLKQTGIAATIVYTGQDPYGVARKGEADLVISHYGHEGVAPFVLDGFGLWPHPVFANQMALFGPPADPARVRGLASAAEALQRIASSKSPFIVNNSAGARYLEDIAAAGLARTGTWYIDSKLENRTAVDAASKAGAYVIWGLPPFLRMKRQQTVNLEPLVVRDPLLQRIMVSVVVNPAKVAGASAKAAKSFEEFLLAPATQAWIAAFRYPEFDQQVWWPAGRHNSARD